MGFADQRRQHVAVVEVVVVVGPVKIGGHDADVLPLVLVVVGIAQLDTSDFRNGVGLVGGLKLTREQGCFLEGLWRQLGVNATGAQEHEALYTRDVGRVDEVGLNHQVLVEKIGPVGVVGLDAPHFGCGNEGVAGLLGLHEGLNRALVEQVEFMALACDDLGVAAGLQPAHDGRAHHAAMSSDEDFCSFVHMNALNEGQIPAVRQRFNAICH